MLGQAQGEAQPGGTAAYNQDIMVMRNCHYWSESGKFVAPRKPEFYVDWRPNACPGSRTYIMTPCHNKQAKDRLGRKSLDGRP
jgi:hypothetical protein